MVSLNGWFRKDVGCRENFTACWSSSV